MKTQIQTSADAEAIAEFLRNKGVTRCPTACVVPTTGTVSQSDREAQQAYVEVKASKARAKRAAKIAQLFQSPSVI